MQNGQPGGVPTGFPQPGSVPAMPMGADSLSKTQIHAPPVQAAAHVAPLGQAMGAPAPAPAAGLGDTTLRMAPRAIADAGVATAAQPAALATPQAQQSPLMQVNPGPPVPAPAPASRSISAPGRIKPRSNALPTPKDSNGKRSTVITGVFVTLALVAGMAIGGFAFNIF